MKPIDSMKTFFALAAIFLASVNAATAHHSSAMFDKQKTVALTGIVKTWEWTNPHTWLVVVTHDAQGKEVEWQLEGQAPTVFRRIGMTRDTIKAGDHVTVVVYPLRSGANGGSVRSITTPEGKTLDLAAEVQP